MFFIFLFSSSTIVIAGPPEPTPFAPVTPGLPIDAPLCVLLIVGIVYVYINFKRRKKNAAL